MNIGDFDKFQEQANAKALEVAKQRGFRETIIASDDQVVVRRTGPLSKTDSGIILAGEKKIQNQGLVLSAGPESGYKANDKVVFGSFAGSNQVELNGEFLLVLRKSEICGIVAREKYTG